MQHNVKADFSKIPTDFTVSGIPSKVVVEHKLTLNVMIDRDSQITIMALATFAGLTLIGLKAVR